MTRPRSYRADWDAYVTEWRRHAEMEPRLDRTRPLDLPGDEWGSPLEWAAYAERFLLPYIPSGGIAIELGPGSGKYTAMVAARAERIVAFDVSPRFLEVAERRLSQAPGTARVELELLESENCRELLDAIQRCDLIGRVDLFFAIDAMQHVELHTLLAYLITASASLRTGGHLVMTVANCTTDEGFDRLLDEMPWYYGGTRPGHPFYFLSEDLVRSVLDRLGFEPVEMRSERDLDFVARKVSKSRHSLPGT